ncbi:MAG: hypothetical protein FWH36_08020 [Lentimicrobiaceae bacterium]|nr:hypothetical protein [Lentimicrobiaceae bacterium]
MRNIKIVLLTATAILFTATSCQKDENGNRITYYKNKTGEGYVFYKFKNDSIAPIVNAKTQIESYRFGMFSTLTNHFDYVYTDNSGKYSFKFVKKINEKKIDGYYICSPYPVDVPINPGHGGGNTHLEYGLLNNSNKFFIDTIFYYIDKN